LGENLEKVDEGYAVGEVGDEVRDFDVAGFELVVEPGFRGWLSAVLGWYRSFGRLGLFTIFQMSFPAL
jgi:hypothetical protein